MINFNDSLKKVYDILNWKCSDEFSEIYSFTTENIKEYLKYFEMNNKKILTVGSSGDQVLNSYFLGAKDITLLDINEFSKYYLYLKIELYLVYHMLSFKSFSLSIMIIHLIIMKVDFLKKYLEDLKII